jgi:hypothetical protein
MTSYHQLTDLAALHRQELLAQAAAATLARQARGVHRHPIRYLAHGRRRSAATRRKSARMP